MQEWEDSGAEDGIGSTRKQLLHNPDTADAAKEIMETLVKGGHFKVSKGTSRKYLRDNLPNKPNDGLDYAAHHDLPLEFASFFLKRGIDPNDLNFGRWIATGQHKEFHGPDWWRGGDFNRDWNKWIGNHQQATAQDILDFMATMRQKYPEVGPKSPGP